MNRALYRLKYSIRHNTTWNVIRSSYKVWFDSLRDCFREMFVSAVVIILSIPFAIAVIFILSIMPLWLFFEAVKCCVFNPDGVDDWIERIEKHTKRKQ